MRKRVLIVCGALVLIIIAVIVIIFLDKNNDYVTESDSLEAKVANNITMEIATGTLTNTGVTLNIMDLSGQDNIYGEWYRLDRLINGTWKEITPINDNYGFNDIAYYPDENHRLKFKVNWEWIYGKLIAGKYRLWKKVFMADNPSEIKYLKVDFIID